jgi:uncharacterized protein YjbJ (UPF0337 family)
VSFLGDAKSALGDAESSLGDAKSSLGDAESSLGDAKSSLGDATSSLRDAKSSLGDAESSLGDAKSSLGDAESSLGDAESSLGDAKSSLGDAKSSGDHSQQQSARRCLKPLMNCKDPVEPLLKTVLISPPQLTSLVATVGDGLAEPVGINLGKHKYRCRSMFGNRTYVRSWEGSACVLFSGIFFCVLMHSCFDSFLQAVRPVLDPAAPTRHHHHQEIQWALTFNKDFSRVSKGSLNFNTDFSRVSIGSLKFNKDFDRSLKPTS